MTADRGKLSHKSTNRDAAHKPDWSALRLFNQYRLLILMALAAIYYFGPDQRMLGNTYPTVFVATHIAYFLVTLFYIFLKHVQKPSVSIQFFIQNYLDIIFIGILMYSSGGISSGLGPLLLINIALLSHLSSTRHALLFAAISSMVVIGEEVLGTLTSQAQSADFQATALLGTLLFLTAWLMTVPLRQLLNRQMVTPTNSRVVLDVRQVAQLNEEIIRELDSGVLVVNSAGHVQMMNDTARMLLAAEFVSIPIHLKNLSVDLMDNMLESERSPTLQTRPFDVSSTRQAVLPHYTRLSTGGMLIRLDDHAHIKKQFQQLKLASLGRLSASIAHEIRNPLGAISHAVQLIQESDTLDGKDIELLKIANRNTKRINRIVEDVLQLSNRQRVQFEILSIDHAIQIFADRFQAENAHENLTLHTNTERCVAMIDAGHLDQVLWNLCTNACFHNDLEALSITISCCDTGYGTTTIDVIDNGKGINDIEKDNLFEPFYSTHHAGTGLGLFIIRELCELNKASIEHIQSDGGAHFRITLATAQDMAA